MVLMQSRSYTIGAWRKGSAAGFDPVCLGSIPGVPATLSQGKALSKKLLSVEFIVIIYYHEFQDSIYIPVWSNGSPPDSKSGRLGSNPRAGAKRYMCLHVYRPAQKIVKA